RQGYARECLDVVVVDNGSGDGTVPFLVDRWRPDAVVDNPTDAAHEPDFRIERAAGTSNGHAGSNGTPTNGDGHKPRARNAGGFASLTVIRNAQNLGGCGGFNTGLAYVDRFLNPVGSPLSYAWLVDDDVDLPEGALEQLVRTAEADQTIGLVG